MRRSQVEPAPLHSPHIAFRMTIQVEYAQGIPITRGWSGSLTKPCRAPHWSQPTPPAKKSAANLMRAGASKPDVSLHI